MNNEYKLSDNKKTYYAYSKCTSCGYRNYPQWGVFEKGKSVQEHKCLNCECRTLVLDFEHSYPPLGTQFTTNTKTISDCLHDNCPACHGTGVRSDGLGSCVHAMSCPCKKCNSVC